MTSIRPSCVLKTSLEFCQEPEIRSGIFSLAWWDQPSRCPPEISADGGRTRGWLLDRNERRVGGFYAPPDEAFRKEGDGFFAWPSLYPTLRSLLEACRIPRRYFLSALGASGVLRRAERRGKKLAAPLEAALRAAAGCSPTSTTTM